VGAAGGTSGNFQSRTRTISLRGYSTSREPPTGDQYKKKKEKKKRKKNKKKHISQKALGTFPEDGNILPKHVGATIHNT
jgi:hypothetical protein